MAQGAELAIYVRQRRGRRGDGGDRKEREGVDKSKKCSEAPVEDTERRHEDAP
jgi:hypothetical protein